LGFISKGEGLDMKGTVAEIADYIESKMPDELPKLGIHKLHDSVKLPTYGTDDAACFDISACLSHTESTKSYTSYNRTECSPINTLNDVRYLTIYSNQRILVPTGIIFDIPTGYSLRLHMRSGIAFKRGLILSNSEGVIDSDYVQETFVMLTNTTQTTVRIEDGERICQGELVKNIIPCIFEQKDAPVTSSDRMGGFGSTGTK